MKRHLLPLLAVSVTPFFIAACGSKTPADAPANPADGPDTLAPALTALAARVAPAMQPEGIASRFSLTAGAQQKIPISLQAGRCYALLGVGQQGAVIDLDFFLLGPGNQALAQDSSSDNTAFIGAEPAALCPQATTAVELAVVAKSGAGAIAVQVYSKAATAAVPTVTTTATATVPPVDPDAPMKAAVAKLIPKGFEADGAPIRQTIAEGQRGNAMVTLQGGKCYVLVATSSTGQVTDLGMELMSPPLFTIAADKSTRKDNIAVIGASKPQCPAIPLPIPFRVDLSARKGTGEVSLQLYSKTK